MSPSAPEPLVFAPAMESLVAQGFSALSPRCQARLREAGFDGAAKLQPAYPAAVFAACVRVLAEELHPDQPAFEGQRRIGALSTARFADSMLGRAMFGVLGLVGPRRALLRMNHNLAYNFNFVKCAFVERGPTEIEATLQDVMGVAGYFAGIIQSGGERSGGKDVRVTALEDDGHQARFRVAWSG